MWIGEGYVHKFQCEDGSMSADRPASDAASRDALGRWSTATLHAAEPVGILGVAAEPPAGRIEMVDGRGVYVRCTADSPAGNRNRPAGGNGEPIDDSADRNSDGDANLAGSIDGPDAWYIHGLAGSSTNWTSLAEALSGHATGYSVDLPGHGRSDPPPRGRYSIRDNADLVAALIRRRSRSPVHLVGNSFGGVISTCLAARHPQLVASLTVISPAVPDLRLTRDRGADPILGLLLVPGTAGIAERKLSALSPMARARGMGRICYGKPELISDSDYEAAAADLAWRAELPWAHSATIGSLRGLLRSYFGRSSSFRADAAKVSVPALVIWGTRDALVDVRLARTTSSWFSNCSLLILPGVGHTAQMEEPVLTARAVARLWMVAGESHIGATAVVATSWV